MKNKVPKLRFPEFSGEWEEKKLGEIGKVSMCKRIMKDQTTVSGEIPFYKIGTFGKQADAFITYELFNEYKSKYSYPAIGDILLSASGTIGRTVIYDGKLAYFQDSNIVWISNNEKLLKNNFLYYLYSNMNWTTEDTTIARLYNNNLISMKVNIPFLPEQEKIASFLSKVDESIEILEEEKELWEKYKKGMMQKIFSQKLRFKDENGNDYPEWEEKILENITDYVDYRGKTPTKTESGVFLVTAKNIKMGYIDYKTSKEFISQESYDEAMRRGLPKIGDVLFTTEAPMGNVAQVDNENIALAQRVIKFRGKSILNNTFLKYSFINDKFQNELLNNAIGTTVLGIQGKVLHKMKINIPSLPEQEKIANFLSSIDEKIELIEKDLQGVKEFKKGLLQQMFV